MISQTLSSSKKDSLTPLEGFFFFFLKMMSAPSFEYFGISKDWLLMGVGCEYLLELLGQIKQARTSVFILKKFDILLEAELI